MFVMTCSVIHVDGLRIARMQPLMKKKVQPQGDPKKIGAMILEVKELLDKNHSLYKPADNLLSKDESSLQGLKEHLQQEGTAWVSDASLKQKLAVFYADRATLLTMEKLDENLVDEKLVETYLKFKEYSGSQILRMALHNNIDIEGTNILIAGTEIRIDSTDLMIQNCVTILTSKGFQNLAFRNNCEVRVNYVKSVFEKEKNSKTQNWLSKATQIVKFVIPAGVFETAKLPAPGIFHAKLQQSMKHFASLKEIVPLQSDVEKALNDVVNGLKRPEAASFVSKFEGRCDKGIVFEPQHIKGFRTWKLINNKSKTVYTVRSVFMATESFGDTYEVLPVRRGQQLMWVPFTLDMVRMHLNFDHEESESTFLNFEELSDNQRTYLESLTNPTSGKTEQFDFLKALPESQKIMEELMNDGQAVHRVTTSSSYLELGNAGKVGVVLLWLLVAGTLYFWGPALLLAGGVKLLILAVLALLETILTVAVYVIGR